MQKENENPHLILQFRTSGDMIVIRYGMAYISVDLNLSSTI